MWNNFMGLKEQNALISYLVSDITTKKQISSWQSLITRLPVNIYTFSRRYLTSCLANGSNLKRWKFSINGNCGLCNKLQTQLHVFNNCVETLDRYDWRHNSVL